MCGASRRGTVTVLYIASHVPEVVAVVGVAADPANGVAEVVAVTGVLEVLKIVHVPAVFAVQAIGRVQHDPPSISQHQFPNWNNQILIAMSKSNVFKKNSPQYQILHQNLGHGYSALFQIITLDHPTLGKFPHLLI